MKINLKTQLIIGFIVPVIFVFIVGIFAYNKAEEGMIGNYENSAVTLVGNQLDYLDFGFSLLKGDLTQLKLDTELQSYLSGLYRKEKSSYSNYTRVLGMCQDIYFNFVT